MAETPTLDPSGTTAAVIVTHKRVELLRNSLEQVVNQTHPVDWVIVVDNGCEDEVRELVEKLAGERAVYLPSRTNLGGAGGFAYGFLHALALGADAIWCADDDGRPADHGVLEELYRVAGREGLHEVSPVVANIDDPQRLAFPLRQGVVWRRRRDELEGDFLPGIASLFNGALISAAAMERIGVPDYRLFIRGDEVEYHRRLKQSGLKFGTALTTAYVHPDGSGEFHPILGGKAHAQFPDNETKRFFTYRNRGYIINQRGMKQMKLQEVVRFGWFFLIQRKNPQEFRNWLSLLRRGAREDFRRP
ncbi:glycosyltransferase [Corynebacterium lubricantis]|uniref:galactofuranosyltransferase GlfT1 n=1 Tax=Corynebacterium lubricantis TaxID=541095 RepID=UPI00035E22AA|nr:glycosyltransferase family 2 protein [Corynebacterium lubricantis]